MKESYSVYDALNRIRKRPGMYIGKPTLDSLAAYECGYLMAMSDMDIKVNDDPSFDEFYLWIRRKYGFEGGGLGWMNMILAAYLGENPKTVSWETFDDDVTLEQHKGSVELFYTLLDEYYGKGNT